METTAEIMMETGVAIAVARSAPELGSRNIYGTVRAASR